VGRLRQNIRTQLARLFGAGAGAPVALHLKDWAYDPFTATAEDAVPLKAHPRYGLPLSMTGLWGNQLILSGTETALQSGGYIEGALEAADTALTTICPSPTRLLRPQKRFA
jgi:monoamine oxidase